MNFFKSTRINIFAIIALSFYPVSLSAITRNGENDSSAVDVFYDGDGSFSRILRTEIDFVNFVRNPDEAQVLMQINSKTTGDGGKSYLFLFEGLNDFEGMDDTLSTSIPGNFSDFSRDVRLVKIAKLGIVRYIAKTSMNKFVEIDFSGDIDRERYSDGWDNWIFSVGLNGSIEAEESKEEIFYEADMDANRITALSKIKISGNIANEAREFSSDDQISKASKRERTLTFLYVHSLSENFSAGFFSKYISRTYENKKINFNFAPAVEYNFFPYSESVRRNFTIQYRVNFNYYDYYETTIFFKDSENLLGHSLKFDYEINETWGEANFDLEASNYWKDFNKNRIELNTRISLRLTGSFALRASAEISYINDQLYLPAEEATFEEILLNQQKLSTQYEYKFNFGIRYTFGSLYNSVVNTRF